MLKNRRLGVGFFMTMLLLMGGAAAQLEADKIWPPGPPPSFPDKPAVTPQRRSGALQPRAYLPLVFKPAPPLPWINTQDRTAVKQAYLIDYMASEGVGDGWTGNHSSCNPGTTSPAFRDAILNRINYFRAMAGIPPVLGFNTTYNSKAQAAALMMSVNGQLNHNPPNTWTCYTAAGHEGAGSSNLYLGVYGPAAISGYMLDPGGGNSAVGHRRWILYPQTQLMGTGDIPSQGGYWRSNALWVFDSPNMWGPRPATRESFVAWPPPGYVPFPVVYSRWSFSVAKADFSGASVSFSRDGQPVGVNLQPIANGYGENTLVWELAAPIPPPTAGDIIADVTVNNVRINGIPQNFSYQVIVFDPNN